MAENYDSVHYDSAITKALKLDNQTLQLDARKDTEPSQYEESREGIEIIELLDNTAENERRVLGHCTFKVYNQPIPFFYVGWVVRKSKTKLGNGKTIGDLVMERTNEFIKHKKIPGILGNVVPSDSSAHNVYERNGWKNLPNLGHWMGNNLPTNLTPEQVAEIVKTIKADDPYFASHPEE